MKKPPLFKKIVRTLLVLAGLAVFLATLLIGASLYGSHRSRLDWEARRAAGIANGVEYNILRLTPPPIPDEENFYATPLLAPVFTNEAYRKELEERLKPVSRHADVKPPRRSWRHGKRFDPQAEQVYFDTQDWSTAFQPYETMLEEITAAAARPAAVMPLPYKDLTGVSTEPFQISIALANLYSLRAKIALSEGRPEAAWVDLQTLFRLSRHLTRDPFVVSGLVAISHFYRAMGVYWEGMVSHQWSNEQLSQIQEELQKFDFLAHFHRALQGERAVYVHLMENLLRQPAGAQIVSQSQEEFQLRPNPLRQKGWLYQNLTRGDCFLDEHLLPQVDLAERRVDPAKSKAATATLQRLKERPKPRHFFVVKMLETQCDIASPFGFSQTLADLGIVVAELERYQRQHGGYPDTLAALLSPRLKKLPHDLVTGEPLRYRRTDDGRFLLYSVGWNGTDDGGANAKDHHTGDWAWPMPVDSPPTE